MKTPKSLLQTNPYLSNRKTRERLLIQHAAASARIEGVKNAKKRAHVIAIRSTGSSAKHA